MNICGSCICCLRFVLYISFIAGGDLAFTAILKELRLVAGLCLLLKDLLFLAIFGKFFLVTRFGRLEQKKIVVRNCCYKPIFQNGRISNGIITPGRN